MINRYLFPTLCLLVVRLLAVPSNVNAEKPVLRVLNWSEYISVDESIDDGLAVEDRAHALREFSKAFECDVEYYEYEETSEAMSRLSKNVGFYDVVVASSGEVERMLEGGLLEAVNKKMIPNHRYISLFYDEVESERSIWDYAMPYLYGTTGIAYRTDLCEGRLSTFEQFFDPEFSQGVKRIILNDCQVMFGLANLYLGNDPNENRKSNHNEAAKVLHRLKQSGSLESISSNVELIGEKLIEGEVGFAIMYSGDAVAIAQNEENLEYLVPSEGAEYFVDSFVISSLSTQKKLAHEFINFMLRPEINARESMDLKYPTLNLAALSIVEKNAPEQLLDENIYPLPETLGGLFEFSMHSALQLRYWERFLNED